MGTELLGIQPSELKFTFELKKQSSCSVQLVNNSDQCVAFKVKTTSPKRYCVRPNTGIIQPNSSCDFTVTMQAQRLAPPDMQCKDKFLIQSTIVPLGTIAEDITSAMFAKDSGRYIEESKLKVIFVSPPNSPVLGPVNGSLKLGYGVSNLRGIQNGADDFPLPHRVTNGVEELKLPKDADLKRTKDANEIQLAKDADEIQLTKDVDLKPAKDTDVLKLSEDVSFKSDKDVEDLKITNDVDLKPAKHAEELKVAMDIDLKPAKDAEDSKPVQDMVSSSTDDFEELKPTEHAEELKQTRYMDEFTLPREDIKLARDVEELKANIRALEAKLNEAEITISRLRVERSKATKESQTLKQELALLRRNSNGARKAQVGFPFLFVCMVALISVVIGYLLRR
ncbi:hypothetical protein Sjap_007604 [Stephania japonica]|uniref:MSP domain-containing protein n=1 Tax=Stephania japonica TaxID=461633 RepID=A0AAP0JQ53_9MAGN